MLYYLSMFIVISQVFGDGTPPGRRTFRARGGRGPFVGAHGSSCGEAGRFGAGILPRTWRGASGYQTGAGRSSADDLVVHHVHPSLYMGSVH